MAKQNDYSEDTILELFHSADASAQQAAMIALKGEKPQLRDLMSMLSGVMEGEGSKGVKALDAATMLAAMLKGENGDFAEFQSFVSKAAGLINNVCGGQNTADPEIKEPEETETE